jgi:regulator of sirC expression with transglutaminase-like and TPR domain
MSQFLHLNLPTPLAYFATLVADDVSLNLLEAATAIAQDEFPSLDIETQLAEVDQLARRLKQRLPTDAVAAHKLRALVQFFNHEQGFAGNANDYYEPGNSYVHHVLATRRGIPVTLAVIFIELASQLGLRAHGVSFPGHFLVKLKLGAGDVVLDPMTGESLSRDRLEQLLQAGLGERAGPAELSVERFLQAAPARQILARMLRNLKLIHRSARDLPRQLAVQQRLVVLLPDDPAERRDRGLLLEALGQWPAAAQDLAHYLARSPRAPDRLALGQMLERLQQSGKPPLH